MREKNLEVIMSDGLKIFNKNILEKMMRCDVMWYDIMWDV